MQDGCLLWCIVYGVRYGMDADADLAVADDVALLIGNSIRHGTIILTTFII